jgi:hypothetical protein
MRLGTSPPTTRAETGLWVLPEALHLVVSLEPPQQDVSDLERDLDGIPRSGPVLVELELAVLAVEQGVQRFLGLGGDLRADLLAGYRAHVHQDRSQVLARGFVTREGVPQHLRRDATPGQQRLPQQGGRVVRGARGNAAFPKHDLPRDAVGLDRQDAGLTGVLDPLQQVGDRKGRQVPVDGHVLIRLDRPARRRA